MRTRGFEVGEWIEAACVFSEGRWIGQPARLLDWEWEWLAGLFKCDERGERVSRWSYTSVAKKNGKTELGGWLGAYFLVGDDEPAPRIGIAASADKQANLAFTACARQFDFSPALRGVAEVFPGEGRILIPSRPGARLERIAASGGVNDGPSWSHLLLDELHEWTEDKMVATWDILTNGVAARACPLIVQFTTAGYDLDTLCGRQYLYAKDVLSGKVKDPAFHVFIREAAPGDNYRLVRTWRKANPSYGLIQRADFYRDQLSKKSEAVFRRYFCNQWTTAEEIWDAAKQWRRLAAKKAYALDPALPLFVGVDYASRRDSAAIVAEQRQADGRRRVKSWVWSNPYRPSDPRYRSWRMNPALVRERLLELREGFPVPAGEVDGELLPGPAFGYDPHKMVELADTLEGLGLNMVEVPQTDSRMVPATRALEEAIEAKDIEHDGDPTLTAHIENVTPKEAANERGTRISKPRGSRKHIDGATALAIANWLLVETPAPEERRSAYEDNDLLVV